MAKAPSTVLLIGAAGGGLGGAALFLLGLREAASEASPLAIALIVVGLCCALASFFATRGSRLGWAFATSICGTLALCFLLGAPKLRHHFHDSLALAAVPALLFAIVTTLLAISSADSEVGK